MADKNANRRIGQAGVMRVKAELMLRGFDVAEPDVDCGVDLIAWDHRSINRIQVKATTQRFSKNYCSFHTTKLVYKDKGKRANYDPKEVDYIICVSIPLNEYWIVPAKDAASRCKMCVSIGDEYHNKWFYLSKCNREIDGDKYGNERELKYIINGLERQIELLKRKLKICETELKISDHKLYNFHYHLRDDLAKWQIYNIEGYGTDLDESKWHTLWHEKRTYIRLHREDLDGYYEELIKLKNCENDILNPANGTQGDPAAGCPPSVYAS